MPLVLHAAHASAGATFTPYGEREMVASYGDPAAEALAVRRKAGLIDWSGGTRLRVEQTGRRTAVDFLQGMLSNDLANLGPDGGCYAALLTNTGKMLADCRVWPREDHVLLATESATGSALRETLTKYGFLDDIDISDISDELGLLGLYGPDSAHRFDAAVGTALPGLAPHVLRPIETPLGPLLVTRSSVTGEVGFDLFASPGVMTLLWEALAGAGVRPCGLDAFHILRVEAGVPWVGVDVDDTVLPNAAGLEHAVSYTKGCYIGQEAVAKLHYLGRASRVLVGIRLGDAEPPTRDTPLEVEGKVVGRITSAVRSPNEGETLALGLCKAACAEHGQPITIASHIRGTIARLPFRPSRDAFMAIPDEDLHEEP